MGKFAEPALFQQTGEMHPADEGRQDVGPICSEIGVRALMVRPQAKIAHIADHTDAE